MLKDIRSDEASAEDRLNRQQFARAFARLGEDCQTPLVVGIFGTWGVGKTSFMRLIEHNLNRKKALPLWFDPWMHQFDENPVVALAHTLVNALEPKWRQEGKKLLVAIANAFGSALLKRVTGLKPKDIYDFQKIYEEEGFLARDVQVRLRDYFKELVDRARGVGQPEEPRRLIFFIDDLDRCLPEEALKVLEALKLYLNLEGCVYFLGVDREALEHCIKHRYQDLQLSGVDYLDKMVQLPFYLPLIDPEQMGGFVDGLLPTDLKDCREMLVQCLGDNPRQVKRFINNLVLNHYLARQLEIPDYRPQVLALLLLLQLLTPSFYRRMAAHPLELEQYQLLDDDAIVQEEVLSRNEGLKRTIKEFRLPDAARLQRYIYLTRVAGMQPTTSIKPGKIDLTRILEQHREWLIPDGRQGKRADLSGTDLIHENLTEADLRDANLWGANLSKANLSKAILRMTTLWGAILTMADLSKADLIMANLSKADMSGASLRGANLSKADMSGASLKGADLTGANLEGAHLEGADLSDAKITKKQISEAHIDEYTILPENVRPGNPKAQ